MRLNIVKKLFCLLLPLAGALVFTGCQTYEQQNGVVRYWRQGDLTNAFVVASKKVADNPAGKNAVIWQLEQAAVLRAGGRYQESNEAFDRAQARMDDYAQQAKVRLGQEAGALLSNQANLAYEGRAYDGIMLNTYKALNYLALGEAEKARPELIRAYQRQQDAVEDNKKRIAKVRDAVAQSENKEAIRRTEASAEFRSQMQGSLAEVAGLQPYANYVNPFTVYLDGIYFLAQAADNSDLERAHKSLERASAFAAGNRYVKEDLKTVESVQSGKPQPPVTYVIFETGCAPVRDQIRIDIPIIISRVSYVGAAFPVLKPQGNHLSFLNVSAGNVSYPTMTVASMDGVIAQDFKNELPVVITKTIAATVTKAVAAYAINEAARNAGGQQDALGNNLASIVAQIGTAAYEMAVNIADTRTWTTLPKEFQVARLPTPADRKIDLTAPNDVKTSVTLVDGLVNVVYVKSIATGTPLLVSQFKLK
jgi:uncharacterized protein